MPFYWICSSCKTRNICYKWIDRCQYCGYQWDGDVKDIVMNNKKKEKE